jgi:hypothetical protein
MGLSDTITHNSFSSPVSSSYLIGINSSPLWSIKPYLLSNSPTESFSLKPEFGIGDN